MPLKNPLRRSPRRRPQAALTAVAAISLAAAGIALLSAPSGAAPSAAPAQAEKGYTGAPANPAPYTLTQPDGSTLEVRAFGDRLSNGVATVEGN